MDLTSKRQVISFRGLKLSSLLACIVVQFTSNTSEKMEDFFWSLHAVCKNSCYNWLVYI